MFFDQKSRRTKITYKYVNPKKEQKLITIAEFKSFYIGFHTNILSKNRQLCYFEFYFVELKRKNENKAKLYFFLRNNNILGVQLKKLKNFKCDNLIIECSFNSYMFMDDQLNFKKNIFLKDEDQLLRNWSIKPTIRFEFSNNEEKEIFFELFNKKINKKNFFKKMKRDLFPLISYNSSEIILMKRQEEFLCLIAKMDRDIMFNVFGIISNGTLNDPVDIDFDFLNFLIKESKNLSNIRKINVSLENILANKAPINSDQLLSRFKNLYNKLEAKPIFSMRNPDSFKIKKVMITPNNIIFHSHADEYTNRILTRFKENIDKFLTITFCSVKFQKMSYCFDNCKSLVNNHIQPILKYGLKIGSHKYKFLCYSNSQLRSHSIWMIEENPDKGFTFDNIFGQMGDFTKEKTISKNASRRGLLFTTAKLFKHIDNVKEILDKEEVVDENDYCSLVPKGIFTKKYCFTDGVGRISYDLALDAAKLLFQMPFASAYQIRFGGYKGVLSSCDDLKENSIELRKSMRKFQSPLKDLFIIRPSIFSKGYLNRQIIILLNSLGVKDEIFMKMQDVQISELDKISNLEATDISHFVEIDFVHTIYKTISKDLVDQKKFKFFLKNDPFIFGIARTVCMSILEELKNKAKIYDPFSGKLIGIIDEYDILKNNEVYICINKTNDYNPESQDFSKCEIIKGRVVVTKNPCMYQGDIQICNAISHPKLKKYVNVVVFPKLTIRPIQQLISDGDLDGDIFYVSWNPDIINNIQKKNLKSMDYIQIEIGGFEEDPNKENMDIVERDMIISFFCSYLQNDILGTICNRHLGFADQNGPDSPECLKLATFQSSAVNFGKYGSMVSYNDLKTLRITEWPDYMEKERVYKSEHVIGKMYRHIKNIYNEYMAKIFEIELKYKFRYEMLNFGFEFFILICSILLYDYYYDDVHSYMKKYNIHTEFEFFMAKQVKFKNNKFGKNYYDSNETIKYESEILRKNYKEYYYAVLCETYTLLIKYFGKDSISSGDIFQRIKKKQIGDIIKLIQAILNKNDGNQLYFDEQAEKFFANSENPEFLKIKNCFLSAIYFITYMHYAQKEVLLEKVKFAKKKIFLYSMIRLEENKYIVYRKYRDPDEESEDFDYSDLGTESEYYEGEFLDDDEDELPNFDIDDLYFKMMKIPIKKEKREYFLKKYKVFYSFIWIIEPTFLLEERNYSK